MKRSEAFVGKMLAKFQNPFFQILLLFIITRFILALQLGDCTAFAPDELSYLKILILTDKPNLVTSDLPWAELPRFARILIFLPALLLHKFGISYLLAFRFQTIFYSAIAVFSFYMVVRSIVNHVNSGKNLSLETNKNSKIYLALIVFMPTTIIWSSLGLREPLLYLTSGVIALAFSRLSEDGDNKFSLKWLSILFIGLEILAVTKLYLFLIVIFSLLVALLISKSMSSKVKSFIVIPIFLATLIQGSALQQIFDVSFSSNLTLSTQPSNFKKLSISIESLRECQDRNQGGPLIKILGDLLIEKTQTDPNSNKTQTDPNSNKTQTGPNSNKTQTEVIPATDYELSKNRYQLNPVKIPMGLISFLFFPIGGNVFGMFSIFGILESIFWIPLYVILVREIRFSRKRQTEYSPLLIFLFLFIIDFAIFSAATEVNFGTAIRHRSILLLPIITSTSILYLERKRGNTLAP